MGSHRQWISRDHSRGNCIIIIIIVVIIATICFHKQLGIRTQNSKYSQSRRTSKEADGSSEVLPEK